MNALFSIPSSSLFPFSTGLLLGSCVSKFQTKTRQDTRISSFYLLLFKSNWEFVSKKKKLQMTKQKRDILSTEIRFLRQRHRYLMAMWSHNHQLQQDQAPPQNSSMQSEDVGKLLRAEKKLKDGIINGKRVQKKIPWQDQSTVMKI
ncbi:uncharacterized protein LOC110657381 isoform X1 [Hevea brasiliensis]|uniref:uncharacterized protein LOC110657381 isoform X1 n=1 Tax=Hevea brasiliensis TaxID=3981 RepID=UPI0025D03B4B|nr:uncharacterized protein LOC110657381 isoform X1 [Hevea brasiliensis]